MLALLTVILLAISLQPAAAERPTIAAPGLQFIEEGEYGQAYDFFFSRWRENPENLEINFYLGKAAYGMGDYEAAVMAFERVLILDPGAAAVQIELGKSFHRLGSREAARHHFEEALQADLPEQVREDLREFLAETEQGTSER